MPESVNVDPNNSRRKSRIRWKWYHFYFLLALFDVVVIIMSLALYDRVLASYEVALRELGGMDIRQHWLAEMRTAVVRLNAPGNDVFETRDVAGERTRFDNAHADLQRLMKNEAKFDIDLDGFHSFIARMVAEETAIFDRLASFGRDERADNQWQTRLEKSVTAMAAMDRYQAGALSELSGLEAGLNLIENRLHDEFGASLERSATAEKLMLPAVILALLGIFFYGRKLQRLHEQMTRDREMALTERSERLASIGELCTAVAHGIRNPLAAINSSAQLALQYGTLDEDSHRRVNDILDEGRRLGQRINRLLDFADSSFRPRERFDLRSAVLQAVKEVQLRLDERNIDVRLINWDQEFAIYGTEEWIIQSVIEVLSNAIDHLDREGIVTISCGESFMSGGARAAKLRIADNGPGIKSAIRDRVFDLFFTSKNRGIGIGLASVKRAIEFHSGSVTLVDTTSGACFEFVLPIGAPDIDGS